jgi:hypothetical protein
MSPCPYQSVPVISTPPLLYFHYGEKIVSGLVKIAQVARIHPVEIWRCLRGVIIDNTSTFMQDNDEEGTMPAPFMVVVHEVRFSIFLQKETDARLRGADQVGWRVLINLWSDQLRHAVFSPSAGDRPHAPLNRQGSDSIGPVACDRVFSASSFPT